MFRELPLLERFAAARESGFAGAEIQMLAEGDPADMAHAARDAGLAVTLINVGIGDYVSGGPGLSGVPGRESEFARALEAACEAAEILSAQNIHLGPSRVPETETRANCLQTYRSNAALAAAQCARRGLKAQLLLEPMNRIEAPTALFNDIAAASHFLRGDTTGSALGLLFDIYHLAMNGDDPAAAASANRDLIRHVQFSDVPGRHEPGSGLVDFSAAFVALEAVGYRGWFGAEYFPAGVTREGLDWLATLDRARRP
jgi:hydroxypyruvate isomerase